MSFSVSDLTFRLKTSLCLLKTCDLVMHVAGGTSVMCARITLCYVIFEPLDDNRVQAEAAD